MTESGRGSAAVEVELRAGAGDKVRREYQLRALLAAVIAMVFLAGAVYGGYGLSIAGAIGVPFLVFGVVGALAQFAAAAALLSARTAIATDRYDRSVVTRARRSIGAVLITLAIGGLVAFIVVKTTLEAGLAGLTAAGFAAAFTLTMDGWRALRHLG
jgi:hypothetical protein